MVDMINAVKDLPEKAIAFMNAIPALATKFMRKFQKVQIIITNHFGETINTSLKHYKNRKEVPILCDNKSEVNIENAHEKDFYFQKMITFANFCDCIFECKMGRQRFQVYGKPIEKKQKYNYTIYKEYRQESGSETKLYWDPWLELTSNAENQGEATATESIHQAAQDGNDHALQFLLENNAAVNKLADYNIEGHIVKSVSALHLAARYGHVKCVKLLLDHGAGKDLKDSQNWTPLHHASGRGHLEVVKLLLEKGAKIDAKDKDDDTSLHCACYNGHLEIVKLLLEKDANINVVDKNDDTPLHRACNNGHLEIVELLLENGANINVVNKASNTPLNRACDKNHSKIVNLLLEKGADPNVVGTSHDIA